ncbi:hypothetical protein OAO01_00515 [Oligoflexia bacterium]|nr:hypothetical protein [Oligoflexia bacterium]
MLRLIAAMVFLLAFGFPTFSLADHHSEVVEQTKDIAIRKEVLGDGSTVYTYITKDGDRGSARDKKTARKAAKAAVKAAKKAEKGKVMADPGCDQPGVNC